MRLGYARIGGGGRYTGARIRFVGSVCACVRAFVCACARVRMWGVGGVGGY